jgi:predicted dehydrogenase
VQPLTHAGGYVAAGFKLLALVDADPQALARERRWGCGLYDGLETMMQAAAPDVISFAVPVTARAGLLDRALAYRPKVVVAEKPLGTSSAEDGRLIEAYRRAGIPLIVNYSRRFVPFWQKLRGTPAISTTIRYAKGIRHNGTHAIDLCRMLFGECLSATAVARKADFWADDPTVSAFLRFERCPEVFLQGLDERCFTMFEVDIVTPSSRIVVDMDGRRARIFELRDGAGVPPGKRLVATAEEDTGAGSAMLNLMHHVREVLAGAAPLCTGEDALAAQRVAEQLSA